jgi:hypothetical protein
MRLRFTKILQAHTNKTTMNKPHTGKINVTKILKEHLFKGEKGTYLDIAIWPNKDGADEWGNTHYVTQSVSKEARERGEKGAIIGNLKWVAEEKKNAATGQPRPKAGPSADTHDDYVPF